MHKNKHLSRLAWINHDTPNQKSSQGHSALDHRLPKLRPVRVSGRGGGETTTSASVRMTKSPKSLLGSIPIRAHASRVSVTHGYNRPQARQGTTEDSEQDTQKKARSIQFQRETKSKNTSPPHPHPGPAHLGADTFQLNWIIHWAETRRWSERPPATRSQTTECVAEWTKKGGGGVRGRQLWQVPGKVNKVEQKTCKCQSLPSCHWQPGHRLVRIVTNHPN